MNSDLKLDLINKIANTNDAVLLEEVKKLVDLSDSDVIYHLSENQLAHISAAEEDIRYGNVIDHESAKEKTAQWLKKQSGHRQLTHRKSQFLSTGTKQMDPLSSVKNSRMQSIIP